MIQDNEIRSGNFFHDKKSGKDVALTFQITHYVAGKITLNLINLDSQLSPIPLTEEWLLKFGFQKEIRSSMSTSVKDVYNWSYNGRWIIKFSKTDGYCTYQTSIVLRYVHELQNAHFIFFGEELTIKEYSIK